MFLNFSVNSLQSRMTEGKKKRFIVKLRVCLYSIKILCISQVIHRIVTYVVRHQGREIVRRKTILHFIENLQFMIFLREA